MWYGAASQSRNSAMNRSSWYSALLAAALVPVVLSAQAAARLTPADSAAVHERENFVMFIAGQRRTLVEAAEAMPADKYGFAPTAGEFANVRTFSKQVRHLAATNYI